MEICHLVIYLHFITLRLASKQALQGALVAGREKEGELLTTSLESEYLHRKSLYEMLIGRDDISNDVITLGRGFYNVCLHSRSFPLCTNWWKSDSSVNAEPQENWKWNSNSREVVTSSPSLSHATNRAPRRACLQATLRLLFNYLYRLTLLQTKNMCI